MGETISVSIKKMVPSFWWPEWWVLAKTRQVCRSVLTKVVRAARWVQAKTGQAVKWVITKSGQVRASLVARLYNGCRKLGQAVTSTAKGFLSGGDSGKQQSPGSPVSPDTGLDRRIDIPVDDEHQVLEPKSAGVAGESSAPPVAVPEVTPKDQLVAVEGSTIGEDEEKSIGVVCGSPALPMAAPVMVGNSSALSEPKLPRFGRLGRYDGGQWILLVGEGDFSFSACLASAFGDASNMVATSLDTLDFLKKNYKRAPQNIMELKRRGCEVIHEVDATKMANHPRLCSIEFDRIIYNFPFWGFFNRNEPREVQISFHQSLVSAFMANAKEMIGDDGEIHITHKCNGFSREWNIVELGTSAGLELVGAVQFKLQDYQGYCTKYGFGGDKNFDCNPSKTYKFKLAPKK